MRHRPSDHDGSSYWRGTLVAPCQAELVKTFREKIAQKRFAKQITGGPGVASFRSLAPQILPFINRAVAPAEPHQRDQIDLLILGERIDEPGHFTNRQIVSV